MPVPQGHGLLGPIASLGPILGLAGMGETLSGVRDRVVAVTPIVAAVPITDPGEQGRARSRARLLTAAGLAPTPAGVARFYADVAGTFVLDRADLALLPRVEEHQRVVVLDTLLRRGADPEPLIAALVDAFEFLCGIEK